MGQGIGALVIVILMIITQLIKALKERAEATKQQQAEADLEEMIVVQRPKPVKQPKEPKKRLVEQRSWRDSRDAPTPSKRQTLSKKLSPQGEGERFEADPGTLDAARIVAPTIDPTVKPELESITGIYEEGAVFAERAKPAIALNIGEVLAKPEGIIQAVILAEILNRPAWTFTEPVA